MTDKPMSKAEREKEARIAAFAAGGRQKPASTDLSAIVGPEPDAAPEAQAPAAAAAQPEPAALEQAAPAAEPETAETGIPASEPAALEAVEAAEAPAPAQAPAKPKKSAPAPAKPAPWADAHPQVTVPFMMRLPQDTHMKLTYLKSRIPNTSIQKLVREAIDEKIAKLLKEHYQ